MTALCANVINFVSKTWPWWVLPAVSFSLCYMMVPIWCKMAKRLGMVDMPSARRINKTPIPRGGGVAVFLSTSFSILAYIMVMGLDISQSFSNLVVLRLVAFSSVLVVVGLLDDKFGLHPLVKLGGQLFVAAGAFFWCDVGFRHMSFLKYMPVWLDCICTLFWITGAINAFNLIDGLDGLATGLALIASIGMGGALFFIGHGDSTLIYFTFAASCLAFLRYNFNPASVFLGDTGSMFIGFVLSVLPLLTKSGDSLFVSVGVPMLAMGVPVFDTSLAIIRRLIRKVLKSKSSSDCAGNDHVTRADTDHLHHRILRKYVSQRKAAAILYALASFFVLVGICGIALRDRAAGLFIIAFIIAVVIIVRDMRRIELFDAGRLIELLARNNSHSGRLRRRALSVPLYVALDILTIALVFVLIHFAIGRPITARALHTTLPIRVASVFTFLVLFRTYSTIWGRALLSNYARLVLAILTGTLVGSAIIFYCTMTHVMLVAFSVLFFISVTFALIALRIVRPLVRDVFYKISHGRLLDDPATSRILVYGTGIRYNMFRRELVRSSSKGNRAIIGLIDDDVMLRNLYVGGRRIYGTLHDAPQIIKKLKINAVVIACVLSPERLALAKKIFSEAGVKVSLFSCEETQI